MNQIKLLYTDISASIIYFSLLKSKEVDLTLCLSLICKTLISQSDYGAVVARVTVKRPYSVE